jgi:alkylation response protein AidB-like acyl-CoA dehydrogenase
MTWWSGEIDSYEDEIVGSIDKLCADVLTKEAVERWENERRYPELAMEALASAGWARLAVPVRYGGDGGSARQLVIVHQAIARHSLAVAQAFYSLWVLGAEAIDRLGNDEQREEWLPRIADGSAQIAFALTEPGSGSDAAALTCRAIATTDGFRVTGQKTLISGALVADRIITAVRTSTTADRHGGISLLLINPKAPGVTLQPIDKLGLWPLDLCDVYLDDVHVDARDVLGPEDQAWRQLRPGLAKERLFLASVSVGAMCDVVGTSLEYAKQRESFGKVIGGHQMIAERVVRMRVALDAAAALTYQAAGHVDSASPDAIAVASEAKLYATEAYVSATRDGVQILGGHGFTNNYPLARHYRDAKYLELGGGTSQIQILVLGRAMGLPL